MEARLLMLTPQGEVGILPWAVLDVLFNYASPAHFRTEPKSSQGPQRWRYLR
jgi:hypothetical protein